MTTLIKGLVPALAVSILFFASQPAEAQRGDPVAGAEKAAACLGCHGPNGNSVNPEWPSLAGQSAAYTVEQLRRFRAQHRWNEIMMPLASILSDQDILDIAAYYESQTPVGLEADPSYWQAGEKLYKAGDKARNIPACKACHGPVGRGNLGAGYPAVRAQHAQYTIAQLNAYAASTRYKNPNDNSVNAPRNAGMMATIASRLTAEDIRNLASYMQGMR